MSEFLDVDRSDSPRIVGSRLGALARRAGAVFRQARFWGALGLLWLPGLALAQGPTALTGAVSPRQVSTAGSAVYTASATGGDPATTRYAFFRRRPGGTWIPSIEAPSWQAGASYSWTPSVADAGVWETYIWVKDASTPPTMNTYGYSAGHNSQPIEVFGPPTVPGATTVACDSTASGDCWVTGDFTAGVAASTGGLGGMVYQICRSVDSSGGFAGCDVNLTLAGGTSILVAGSHLPADGYRRAFYFQAKDSAGAHSGWNTPLHVRVDRHPPSVSASHASDLWFSARTATISASDAGSGLQTVRYSWGSSPNATCTNGTSASSGTTLTAPNGDTTLYLCAKDNTGRVAQWSGRYRVSPLALSGSVTPNRASYLGTFTWTMAASGGTPATTRYAFFRRRPGGTWTPSVTAPVWQASGSYTWQPALADAGTWETYVWVKDGDTPAGANTYGYAAGLNTMPIEVVGKPTVPGATTVACAYTSGDDCWVTGDFTAGVTPSTGGMGTLVYDICRSVDSAGGFAGCDATLTLTGGASILVSGAHLPSDGYRRAYYFQAKDAAGAASGWNVQRYVRVDRHDPAVGADNASESWFPSRTATVSASDAAGSAGANSGVQGVRYAWNAPLDAGCTTGTATASGATLTAPSGDNLLYLCARDNTGRVTSWNGRYRVTAPLGLSGSVTPTRDSHLRTFTWTMAATGGDPATTRYAFFRRPPGGTWVPDVSNPAWQASPSYAWTPSLANAGTWETYVWVKDANTPSNQNAYGYAAGFNTGPIEVVGKPSIPGPTTVACAYSSGDDCWVAGDFTAGVAASTGGLGSLDYQICRSVDSAGGFAGCDVNLTLTGGISIAVSGAHLPADGYRRAYSFQAKDSAGALSGWNVQRYVRVDRNAPSVGAGDASDEWFPSRTATIAASDAAGGAGANSGLAAVRYAWNAPLDAGCTSGTATSSGAGLAAPTGDNLLYLCARDRVGRVAQWSGRYRVQAAPAPAIASVSPKVVRLGQETTLTLTGTNLQGASVYIGTAPPVDGGAVSLSEGFPSAELVAVNPLGTVLTVRIDARNPSVVPAFQNLVVDTPGGSAAGQFRLVGTAPIVDVYTPSQPVSGNIHLLMLGGVNLQGAEVVPLDPAVKVLDLDNDDDHLTTGLLYVDSDAPPGTYEVRVERPGGAALSLSLEVVGSVGSTSLQTSQMQIPGQSTSPGVPDVLLQEPVAPAGPLEEGVPSIPGGPGGPGGLEAAFSNAVPGPLGVNVCAFFSITETWTRSAILLALTDFGGEPITREVLNRLLPGQKLQFNSLTTAAFAYLQAELFYYWCPWGTSSVGACFRGGASYMVPFVGGHSASFDLCTGNGGSSIELNASGAISQQDWSSSNGCLTVEDSDPESPSGSRSGEISGNCCSPSDLNVHIAGTAFDTEFDVGGRVMSIQPESCTDPNDCTKQVEWSYLRADGTPGPARSGTVELFSTPDQRQARVSARFLPESGTFADTVWSDGDSLVEKSAATNQGATAEVTLTAGGEPGTATLHSPTYRWEALECRAPVQVSVSTVEVEINLTEGENDDLVEVRSAVAPDLRRQVRGRARVPGNPESDVTVVLTNPDGRLRFPLGPDTTKSLTLPQGGGWVEFEIGGELPSEAKGDAIIEVHQDTAEGALLGKQTMTVFHFTPAEIKATPGPGYFLYPDMFAVSSGYGVTLEASATLQPSGLDCAAPQLQNLRIGIVQNGKAQRARTYVDPAISCVNGPSGRKVTVPGKVSAVREVPSFLNDSGAGFAPLYTNEPGSLAPISCTGSVTAVTYDTPHVPYDPTILLARSPVNPIGSPEGDLTYRTFVDILMNDEFKVWAVSYDQTDRTITPLRETSWYLQTQSGVPSPPGAAALGFDRLPTQSPIEGPPFMNDVLAGDLIRWITRQPLVEVQCP